MATSFRLEGKVDINASAAQAAVQALSQNFTKLSQNSRTSTTTLAAIAPILKEAAKAADIERRSIAAAQVAQERANKVKRESLALAKLTSAKTSAVTTGAADKTAVADAQRLLVTNRALTETVRQRMLVADANSKIQARADATAIANSRLLIAQQRAQATAQRAATQAQEESLLTLTSMRYALFSVSQTALLAGTAMMGVATAGYGIGIAWQKAFAEVVRTSGALNMNTDDAQKAISGLRSQFSELVTTLPISYQELTKIGTLAGQLGVPLNNIGEFTKIVAEFSATTDVSSEAAATAFGRLSAIIPDVKGNYQGLADSILKVGVNSVATESAIINITTQISSVAAQAGFGYKQIIGLSGALASIGVPPELARGVITRVFGDIGRAVSGGGTKLEQFGKVSGMTGSQFRDAWKADAAGTFQKFMTGVQNAGGNAESVIRALGITSVRDVPILLRLANAADKTGKAGALLAQTMGDAATATGELQKQYQVISGTVGAKLQVMFQSLQNAIDKITNTQMGGFGDLIDNITTSISRFTDSLNDNVRILDMFDLPFTNAEALGVGLTIMGIVGAIGLLVAVLGRVASGGIALTQVWRSVSAHFAASAAGVGASTAALTANTTATNVNAAAQGRLAGAHGLAGGALRGSAGAATAAALSYGGMNRAFGAGVPLTQRVAKGFDRITSSAASLGKAVGPELLVPVLLRSRALCFRLKRMRESWVDR
jgi:TP901 family phage tail tape measure protein